MLKRQLVVPVSDQLLWEALTDPEQASAWIGARVSWELRPGSEAQFLENGGAIRHGVVDDVVIRRYLRFRWWEGDEASEVTYQLEPLDGDSTSLKITETPLPPDPSTAAAGPSSEPATGPTDEPATTDNAGWTAWDSRLAGVWGRLSVSLAAVRA